MSNMQKKGLEKLSSLLDLEFNYSHARYNFELGLPLEASLRNFFRAYFPRRYGFASGYIVDEHDSISNQCDWVIYDTMNFSPLMAQIHGTEGAEWLPYESIYGCVEVKRTLNHETLNEAMRQLSITRQLKRKPTDLLQVSPYMYIPKGFLNISPHAVFDEVCNRMYAGIYAFSISEDLTNGELYKEIDSFAATFGPENLPDFIAVHGRYYIRKGIAAEGVSQINITPFAEQCNCFITINSEKLTSGVFYTDLIYQFSNMHLSASSIQTGLGSFLSSQDLLKVSMKHAIPKHMEPS